MKFFTARTLPIFEQCFGQNLTDFPTAGKREHVCDSLSVWLAAKDGALARL